MLKLKIILVSLSLLISASVLAQDAIEGDLADAKKTKVTDKKTNVINFEEDVIEGERKNPNLFLQLDMGTPNMDTILFLRNNFNDFHQSDKDRRMIYRKFN